MRVFAGALLTLTILTPGPVPSRALASSLVVRPTAPRQGEALFVRLERTDIQAPHATWLGKEYPLYRRGSAWVGALPIAPDTAAKTHPLRVRYTEQGAARGETSTVRVARVQFPIQRLRMSGAKSSLYTYPGVKREDAIIGGAARTVSEEAAWTGGDWSLPSKGRLSTPYGVRRLRNGKPVGRHRGLDIAAPEGTPIVAPAAGRVVLAGKYRKHGNTVVLDHGQGVTSIYIHQSRIEVRKGQSVSRGARLGRIGSTGASTGPHLHWSVYVQGTSVNPGFFLRLSQRGVPKEVVSAAAR